MFSGIVKCVSPKSKPFSDDNIIIIYTFEFPELCLRFYSIVVTRNRSAYRHLYNIIWRKILKQDLELKTRRRENAILITLQPPERGLPPINSFINPMKYNIIVIIPTMFV